MELNNKKYMNKKSSYLRRKELDRTSPMFDRDKIMLAVRMMLEAIGENPDREGLVGTPDRVARAFEELFEGMAFTNKEIAEMFKVVFDTKSTFRPDGTKGLVTETISGLSSMCEHHILPIYDVVVKIGYLPKDGKVIGLSKLGRICEMCAHRVQLQEKLGEDIAECLKLACDTEDVIVYIEAKHGCQSWRGSKSQAVTKTASLSGQFETDLGLRNEFYSIVNR